MSSSSKSELAIKAILIDHLLKNLSCFMHLLLCLSQYTSNGGNLNITAWPHSSIRAQNSGWAHYPLLLKTYHMSILRKLNNSIVLRSGTLRGKNLALNQGLALKQRDSPYTTGFSNSRNLLYILYTYFATNPFPLVETSLHKYDQSAS